MSDTWYRGERLGLGDDPALRWHLEAACAGEEPDPPADDWPVGNDPGDFEPVPAWLAAWPEDLQWVAFNAAVNMDLMDHYRAVLAEDEEFTRSGPGPRGVLGILDSDDGNR